MAYNGVGKTDLYVMVALLVSDNITHILNDGI